MSLILAAILLGRQDDPVDRILRRIDQELKDSETRLREDIKAILIRELRGPTPQTMAERLIAFVPRIREDGGTQSRLKKFLATEKGRQGVLALLEQQGLTDFDRAVATYFERHPDDTYSLRPQFVEEVEEWLEETEGRPPPKEKPRTRAWIGFTPDDFTDDERSKIGLDKGWGLRVLEVTKGGPGERAGLRPQDILLTLAGRRVGEENMLAVLSSLRPGESVEAVVLRGEEKATLKITLGEKRDGE